MGWGGGDCGIVTMKFIQVTRSNPFSQTLHNTMTKSL